MPTKTLLLRTTGIVGAAIFLYFLSLTFYIPEWVETFAQSFIEEEVEKRVDSRIDSIQPPKGEGSLAKYANVLYAQNLEQIDSLKESLKARTHEKIAAVLAEVRNLDCECRDKWAEVLEQGFESNIAVLKAANAKIVRFVQASYMEVVENLRRDIQIFTGANSLTFLALIAISFLKPQAITHLFLPGMLLVLSTVICSYFYIFEQNWLLTLIYNDFLGFMYVGYLAVVFGFLCDVVFNRGRITTEIMNALLNAIGSAASVAPC